MTQGQDNTLHNLLTDGGYILYSRHGEANIGNDLSNINFNDCNTQRNLSEKGRMEAIEYGERLRALQIPINYPVIASPFCRTIESAALAFGRQNVIVDPFWYDVYRLSDNLSSYEQNTILNNMKSKFEAIPPKGTNTIIIAHGLPNGISLGAIDNMGTVIIRPLGVGNGYEVVKKLQLKDIT
ncbi:MAG TPA: histidine phosphatase family protein [Clostridiales bacterium]|nr:histidine phosphatase family protein [Clostridiales bacterium]